MSESLTGLEFTFGLLLRTAWCAAILLLIVWIIQNLGARWLSPRARYALWLLVAARLVMLWTPASPVSLVGQLETQVARLFTTQAHSPARNDFTPVSSDIAAPVDLDLWTESLPEGPISAPPISSAPVPDWQWSDIPIWSIVAALWMLGVLLFSALLSRDFWRLRAAIRGMQPASDERALQLVRRMEQQLRWKKSVLVLVSQELASPAVTGVFRPALLLPALFLEQLSGQELEHVIRHELTHVKRRDVLVNWLLAAIGAVYWFFPLMRYLLSQLRKTRELACDAAVLRSASANERKAYGKTLLKVMEMVSEADRPALTFTVGVAGMVWNIGNFRKESKMMRERLELVVRDRTQRGRAGWLIAAMALVLIAVGFTEAQDAKKAIREEEILFLTDETADDRAAAYEYRWIEQSYDFTETRKLFEKSPEFYGAPVKMKASPSAAEPWVKIDPTVSARQVLRGWVARVIKESGWTARMEPTINWHEEDKAIISHSQHSHERLTRALKALHTTPESQHVFEFSVGTLDAEDFAKVKVKDFRVATSGGADGSTELASPKSASAASHSEETVSRRIPSQRIMLDDAQKKTLLTELEGIRSFNRIAAPKVTTLNTQCASITTGVERPFVTGVRQDKEGKEHLEYETVFCGLDIDLQTIALGDATVWLRLNARHTEVLGVEIEDLPGTAIKIQSPKIWLMSQAAGLEMKLGDTLAIFSKAEGHDGKKAQVLALFVTVREAILPPLPAPIGPDGAPLTTTTMRTEVYDVSRTPSLLWFTKATTTNDPLREKLIAPAFDQLEILIKETIDPESPKIIKRSTEKLTLEVTATQEVHEKVSDLIKQLVRLAEEGEPKKPERALERAIESSQRESARRPPGSQMVYRGRGIAAVVPAKSTKIVTCTYDVARLHFFDKLYEEAESKGEPTKEQLDAAFGVLQSYLKITIPAFTLIEEKKGAALTANHENLTIEVTTSEENQELVATALRRLAQVSRENLRDEAIRTYCRQVLDGALALGFTDPSEFNELRKGVEFDPRKHSRAASANNELSLKNEAEVKSARDNAKKSVTVTYDITEFFLLCTPKSKGGKQSDDLDCGNPFTHLFVTLRRRIPGLVPGKEGVELQPFWDTKTLVVSAPPLTQEKVAEVLSDLKKMSAEDAKMLIGVNVLSAERQEQAIHIALQQPTEVKLKDKPLSDVLKDFGETAKINIVMDAAAMVEEGLTSKEPVSLELKKPVALKAALRLILDPLNLGFIVKNETVFVTSKRKSHGAMTTVAYDVAGLPFLKRFAPDTKNANEEQIVAAYDQLQSLIKNTIPCFVAGDKGAEIQPFYTNLTIVVSAPVEDQEKIADLLKIMERISLADAEKAVEESKRR